MYEITCPRGKKKGRRRKEKVLVLIFADGAGDTRGETVSSSTRRIPGKSLIINQYARDAFPSVLYDEKRSKERERKIGGEDPDLFVLADDDACMHACMHGVCGFRQEEI